MPSGQVYSGFVAGSASGHHGSGSNLLCMHPQAQYLDHDDRSHDRGLLYGYEYESTGLAGHFQTVTNREVRVAHMSSFVLTKLARCFFEGFMYCL